VTIGDFAMEDAQNLEKANLSNSAV
jgi:hypothetical protein